MPKRPKIEHPPLPDRLMTVREVCAATSLSIAQLGRMRTANDSRLPWVRISDTRIAYRKSAVEAFIASLPDQVRQ